MNSDDFAHECCVRSVAATCEELGFESAEESALDAIADAVRYFVTLLGKRSHANMTHSRRSRPALNDVLAALKQAPAARTSWSELRKFAGLDGPGDVVGWRLPGAVVPPLPVPKRQRPQRFGDISLDTPRPRSPHIPTFLPPFPPLPPKKKRKLDDHKPLSAADRLRERETLQLALNKMSKKSNTPARSGTFAAPVVVEE